MSNTHPVQPSLPLTSDQIQSDHEMLQPAEAGLHHSSQSITNCNQESTSNRPYIDQEDERQTERDVSTIALLPLESVPQPTPVRGQPHVYLLPTQDRTRLKIGRSIDPLERIAELTRVYPEIDLSRSVILGVDAKIVEKILHAVFEPLRLQLSKRRDGSSEWFVGDFVDEVIDFCQHIAHHRRASYTIIRDLSVLLREHFSQRRTAGMTAPATAKRDSNSPRQPACLAELAIFKAREFVKTLQERRFDEIVVQNNAYFLVRTIRRNDEPECWKPTPWPQASEWGLRLLRSATIKGWIDGGSFVTHLIQIPSFRQQNSERGLEYYRIEQPPENIVPPAADDHAAALAPAFAILWEALAHLPQRTVPLPPSVPSRDGFQRRPRRQGATPAALVTANSLETGRA